MSGSRSPEGPSIVFVVADTTRADVFAEPGSNSPFLDEARRAGRVYERATSPAPWTAPAHASMFTGLAPAEHGIWRPNLFDDAGHPRSKLVQGELVDRWLPVKLKKLGYRTLGISANPWVAPFLGFDAGFDRFLSLKEGGPMRRSRALSARIVRRFPDPVASRIRRRRVKRRLSERGLDGGARRSLETLFRWLAEDRGPFFAFVNFMEPHWPYQPPADFEGFSTQERRHAIDLIGRLTSFSRFSIKALLGQATLPDRDRAMLQRLYVGEVRYLQSRLTELVEKVEAAEGLRDTIVVLVSDHGEQLGEHGLFGHGSSLYEELLHVPLLVFGPEDLVGRGSEPGRVGTQSLYEACKSWARCEGADLNGGFVVAEGDGMWFHPIVRRLPSAASLETELRATSWTAYDGDWKYVRDETGHEALFDLASDPGETRVVGAEGPWKAMRKIMAEALAGRRPGMQVDRNDGSSETNPEIEAQLRALGYM
jgi:arylsulfatase A-like enzyme